MKEKVKGEIMVATEKERKLTKCIEEIRERKLKDTTESLEKHNQKKKATNSEKSKGTAAHPVHTHTQSNPVITS
jgi:hypothetical protein